MRIMFRQRIRHDSSLARVIGITDVVHVAFSGRKARAVLADKIDAGVGAMQPDGRRQPRNIQDHPDSVGLHLVHDLVKPFKLEFALSGLKGIPGEISHAHDIEARALHDGDIEIDLLRCAVDGLITRTDKELPRTRPIRERGRILRAGNGNQRDDKNKNECELSQQNAQPFLMDREPDSADGD